jgi:hypothetical protein
MTLSLASAQEKVELKVYFGVMHHALWTILRFIKRAWQLLTMLLSLVLLSLVIRTTHDE